MSRLLWKSAYKFGLKKEFQVSAAWQEWFIDAYLFSKLCQSQHWVIILRYLVKLLLELQQLLLHSNFREENKAIKQKKTAGLNSSILKRSITSGISMFEFTCYYVHNQLGPSNYWSNHLTRLQRFSVAWSRHPFKHLVSSGTILSRPSWTRALLK